MSRDKVVDRQKKEGTRGKLLKAAGLGLFLYLLLLFIYAGFGLYFPIEHYLFFLWLFLMYYLPVPERVTLITGLSFLGLCPLVLAFANDELANRLARFAFIFLSLGGLKIIIQTYFRRDIEKECGADD